MGLLDEVVQHLLGVLEVGDDPVLHGADGDDVPGRPAEHLLRLLAHRLHPPRLLVHGDDGGLADHDSLAPGVDQGVRGAQIDGEVVREEAEVHDGTEVHEAAVLLLITTRVTSGSP